MKRSPHTMSVQIALALMLAVGVIAVVSDTFRYFAYARLAAGAGTAARADAAETLANAVSITYLLVLAAVVITFMLWVYRTNAHLRRTSGYPIRSTPAWAVGWYFVPVACLFRPLRDMRDIWRASHGGSKMGIGLVNTWWAAVLASNMAWLVAPSPELTSASAYVADSASYLMTDAIGLVPCVLALVMVRRISSAEAARATSVRDAASGADDSADPAGADDPKDSTIATDAPDSAN